MSGGVRFWRIRCERSWCAIGGLLLVLGLGEDGALLAATLHVPENYATIQAAIDAAYYGDQVVVSPGTYPEQLVLRSGIDVAGLGNASYPVSILAPEAESALLAEGVADLQVSGLTFTGSGTADEPPLVLIAHASPTLLQNTFRAAGNAAIFATSSAFPSLEHNVFDGNRIGVLLAEGSDAHLLENDFYGSTGIALEVGERCYPEISGNSFLQNAAAIVVRAGAAPWIEDNYLEGSVGDGILLEGASATIWHNVVRLSGGTAILGRSGSQPNIQHNHFDRNRQGLAFRGGSPLVAFNWFTLQSEAAIRLEDRSYPSILHNVLQDNTRGIELHGGIEGGDVSPHIFNNTLVTTGGVAIHCIDQAYPAIDNNIVAFNRGYGILCEGSSRPTLAYNLVYGNGGSTDGTQDYGGRCEAAATDISADPRFVSFTDDGDPSNDDLHLTGESPAVDAGNPQSAYDDTDGSRNDMGAYGGPDYPSFVDMDGDGFTADAGDCNDADPHTHPGSTEVPDGIDNDCDGGIDEIDPDPTPTPQPTIPPDGSPTPGGNVGTPTPTATEPPEPSPGPSVTPLDITYGEGCTCRAAGPDPAGERGARVGWIILGALGLVGVRRQSSRNRDG